VINSLQLKDPLVFSLSFNRPNIFYEVRYKELIEVRNSAKLSSLANYEVDLDHLKNVEEDMKRYIESKHSGSCGIIYTQKRETCDSLAELLKAKGLSAAGPLH